MRAAGIPVEIVPGVTAAQAAAAATGVCLTRRGLATGRALRHRPLPGRRAARARLGGAGRPRDHARRLHGRGEHGRDRGAADGARDGGRHAGAGGGRRHAAARAAAPVAARRHRPGCRRGAGSTRRSSSSSAGWSRLYQPGAAWMDRAGVGNGDRAGPACVRAASCSCCSPVPRSPAGCRQGRAAELARLVAQDCGSCHGLTLRRRPRPDIRPAALAGRSPEAVVGGDPRRPARDARCRPGGRC